MDSDGSSDRTKVPLTTANSLDEKTAEQVDQPADASSAGIDVTTGSDKEANQSYNGDIAHENHTAPVELTQTQERHAAEAAQDYPTGLKLTIIVLALELAVLCVALDNTIVATAIPKITSTFHALDDVGWYGSSYLLTLCAFQLFFGRLYKRFDVKWVFLSCLFIFELGSLICGVAPSSTALIVGRAVAGVGAAGIFSGSLIIIAFSTPLEKRAMYSTFLSCP